MSITYQISSDIQLSKGIKDLIQRIEEKFKAYKNSPLKMLAITAADSEDYDYGDLVPLGFLNLAWNSIPENFRPASWESTSKEITQIFYAHQTNGLWAFNQGDLITAVDSAFILRSLDDPKAVALLEQFSDKKGSYYPQLFTSGREKDKMTIDPRTRHWCQADYSLFLQVYALRLRAGLPVNNEHEIIRNGFKNGSGLYLANPFFTDWLLADVIQLDPRLNDLKPLLFEAVNNSLKDEDYRNFYDSYLSTALALSTLNRLNVWSVESEKAMEFLMNSLDDLENIPACVPFYSTMNFNWKPTDFWELMSLKMEDKKGLLAEINGAQHRITLYQDRHHVIRMSLALLAINQRMTSNPTLVQTKVNSTHKSTQYTYSRHSDFITNFALPPYLIPENLPNV